MDSLAGGIAFGVALVASASAMPLVQALGARFGMIDAPGTRKIHSKIAVRAGGMGVALGLLVGVFAIALFFFGDDYPKPLLAIGALALPVAFVGMLEDATTVRPKIRLLMQGIGVAAFLQLIFGVIENYAEVIGMPPILVAGVAGFVLLAGINAVNLIDGIDGLAASMVTLSGIGVAAIYGVQSFDSVPALALAGALVGFLPWNMRRSAKRRLFLGDGGSTLIGALITSMALVVVMEHPESSSNGGFDFLLVVGLVGLPLIDEGVSVLRRLLLGRSPLAADQSHIHHFLILANSSSKEPHRLALRDLVLLQAVVVAATVAGFHIKEYAWELVGFVFVFASGMYLRLGVLTPRFIVKGREMTRTLKEMHRMPKSDLEAQENVEALVEALDIAHFAYARIFDRNSRETIKLQDEAEASKEVRLPIPSTSERDNDVLVIGISPGFFRDYGLVSLISPSLPSLRRARRLLADVAEFTEMSQHPQTSERSTRRVGRISSRVLKEVDKQPPAASIAETAKTLGGDAPKEPEILRLEGSEHSAEPEKPEH